MEKLDRITPKSLATLKKLLQEAAEILPTYCLWQ
jgi:hypothetical protein